MSNKLNMPCYVLSQFEKRTPLVKQYLDGNWDVRYYDNPDWEVPPGTDVLPCYRRHCPPVGHYRVFRGHQEMMKLFIESGHPVGLFFEDDAVPNTPECFELVNLCWSWMQQPDNPVNVLYTYGRHYDRSRFIHTASVRDREIVTLRPDLYDPANATKKGGIHYVYGTLAYLVKREAATRIANASWRGIPIDVVVPDLNTFALLHPSPWDHDRQQGSILEKTKT